MPLTRYCLPNRATALPVVVATLLASNAASPQEIPAAPAPTQTVVEALAQPPTQ
jgi:hypothetical protein